MHATLRTGIKLFTLGRWAAARVFIYSSATPFRIRRRFRSCKRAWRLSVILKGKFPARKRKSAEIISTTIWQARKRSSIEIAKGTDAINVSLRETPLDRFIERRFGIAGRLAAANFNNHRVKFKLIARSMSISALMFILFALFRVYLLQNNEQDTAFVFLFNFFYIFIGTLFAATFTGACALFYVHFNRRKSEFAMFRSMGMDTGEMARMVAVEGIYYGIYMFFYLLAGSLIVDGILFAALRLIDDYHFVYPWLEMGIALGIILVIMLALSLFMTVSVKRINIIAELKRNY